MATATRLFETRGRMFCIVITAVLLVLQSAVASASTACAGADPALISVVVKSVAHSAGVNRYNLTGTVVNLGGAGQVSDVLQFVDIYQTREKFGCQRHTAAQSRPVVHVFVRCRAFERGR